MSYENPTRLRIGMHGEFSGKNFRLIGRVVMGVEIDSETYYWNEFNLKAHDGTMATLVFEGNEDDGGEWRLFTLFEPEYPMTALDAATKGVGDALNLNGTDVRVTLVQSSRVYRIEGLAPEGVVVGSRANYFNAEAGDIMQVVSWTGEEVEYYNGCTLSQATVESAFKISGIVPARMFSGLRSGAYSSGDNKAGLIKLVFQIGFVAILLLILFGRGLTSCSMSRESAPVKKVFAAASPLPVGATGRWNGEKLGITTHLVVEIDKVGAIYERNEYILLDDLGNQLLLVCDDSLGAKNWTLFSLLQPLTPPTPQAAAMQKTGDLVNISGVTATVDELFESTIQTVENADASIWHQGDVSFNYLARSEHETLLVRWNNSDLSCYGGKAVPAREFAAAFSSTNKQ